MMFLDCPAYMDTDGVARCGLPAHVQYRYTVSSTDGPLEGVKIHCLRGHWFNRPVEFLAWDKRREATGGDRGQASGPAGRHLGATDIS